MKVHVILCVIEVVLVAFIIYSMFESLIWSLINHLQYRTVLTTHGSFPVTEKLSLVSTDET